MSSSTNPNPNWAATLRQPWQPGQSGNARGVTRGYRRVLAASRKCSLEAMEKAIDCMRDESAPWPPRLKAIELILDRAWGAPDQKLQLDGDGIATLQIRFVDERRDGPLIDAEAFQITLPGKSDDKEGGK